MNVQTLRLDVSKDVIVQQPVIIGQGDKSGTTITATIYDNGILLTQSGLSARFKMRLPDGSHFYSKAASWSSSTGTASVTIDETQAASAPGTTHDAYFELYTGGSSNPTTIYSTSRFTVRVLRSATEAATTAKSYDDRIDEIIAELDGADEAIQAAQSAASAANTAAQSANSAASSANSAASAANTARNNANSAASSATSAAQSATSAASSANTAAGSANTAAQSASSAATAANSAATSATSAADAATSAATDASNAAAAASSAASSANSAATAAGNAAGAANSAASAANSAASDASTAATAANSAASAANDAAGRAEDAVDAIGDISELAVPLMSETTRGGATVGAGLAVIDGALTADPTRTSDGSTAGPVLSLSAEGWAEQDGTPSPNSPVEIKVARGRNLYVPSSDIMKSNCTMTLDGDTYVITATDADIRIGYVSTDAGTSYGSSYGLLTPVSPLETYTLSTTDVRFAKCYVMFWDSSKQSISVQSLVSTNPMTFTTPANTAYVTFRIGYGSATPGTTYRVRVQLERGSTPTPYVPYGHVGLEVQGKNLAIPNNVDTATSGAITWTYADGKWYANGTATGNSFVGGSNKTTVSYLKQGTYTASVRRDDGVATSVRVNKGESASFYTSGTNRVTFTVETEDVYYINTFVPTGSTVNNVGFTVQLERGSVATDYEPYYHSTVPIPLPSKGFAAALPDGTHDTLTIDGAGKVTWESATNEVTVDGDSVKATSMSNGAFFAGTVPQGAAFADSAVQPIYADSLVSASRNGISSGTATNAVALSGAGTSIFARVDDSSITSTATANAWLTSHPVTVLYPLATPVTEDAGYVDLSVPVGASLRLPELEGLGVEYFTDEAAVKLARAWYGRTQAVESRVAALEEAVAELVANG